MVKVTLLGAGSGFTQPLFTDILNIEGLDRGTFGMVDIDEKRLDVNVKLMRRILELDPQMLMPLVVDRLGSSHRIALERLRGLLAAGQADGSVAVGDVGPMALQVMSMAAIHVFSARAYDSVDPRGHRWAELERSLDGYLRPQDESTASGRQR